MKRVKWLLLILVFLGVSSLVPLTFVNFVYLPIVNVEPTLTPSETPRITPSSTPTPSLTPTRTSTPTATPKYDASIFEIVNSDTADPLNEYVSIFNSGYSTVNMTGWYIRDDGLNRYDFPTNFNIASKKIIRLWTKSGQNTTSDLYWGSAVEVWNDVSECAYLRDNSGGEKILVDKYCYSKMENGLMIQILDP